MSKTKTKTKTVDDEPFVQCMMNKPCPGGKIERMVWLPKAQAVDGKEVRLRINGEWNSGWTIKKAYTGIELSRGEVISHSSDWKKTRKVSDV